MLIGLFYITAKNSALKRFTGVTTHDLYVLEMLCWENKPVHNKRLFDLLANNCTTINPAIYSDILKRGVANKLITRTPCAGNVLYAITLDGKRLLYRFAEELESIVKEQVMKYGNGFIEH